MEIAMAHCARRRGRATTGLEQNAYRLLGGVAGWLVGCIAGWLRGGVRLTGSSPTRQVALVYRPSPPLFVSGPPKLESGCNEQPQSQPEAAKGCTTSLNRSSHGAAQCSTAASSKRARSEPTWENYKRAFRNPSPLGHATAAASCVTGAPP